MRTQFLYAGLLSIVAGGLVGMAGCSDTTAGQPTDTTAPPMLVHITIQDAVFNGGTSAQRTSVTDLIDNQPAVSCSDTSPCLIAYLEGFHNPGFFCSCATDPVNAPNTCPAGMTGTCNDPLKTPKRGIPIYTSQAAADPGDAGSGMQIRFVFSKVLSNTIESVSLDKTGTATYTLAPNTIELDDDKGAAVDSVTLYDNGGTPGIAGNTPSDLIQAPLGPAIVIKPKAQLKPKTTYTVKLNTAGIKDRAGQSPVDQNGAALPATYTIQFTTEDITRRTRKSYPTAFPVPDAMTMAAQIAPNEVLNFAFWSTMDPTTFKFVSFTGPTGFNAATDVEVFQAQALGDGMTDATKSCPAGSVTGATQNLHIAHVSAPGMPTDWPAGTYTLEFTVQDRYGVSTYDSAKLASPITFTVTGKDSDTTSVANTIFQKTGDVGLVMPEQCTGMPMSM